MSRPARWRADFIARMIKAGARVEDARFVLRKTATLNRLGVAQLNGDAPASNGVRPAHRCDACRTAWDVGTLRHVNLGGTGNVNACPDCRAGYRLTTYVGEHLAGWTIDLAGDPRGSVVTIYPPVTRDGRHDGIVVP